MLDHTTATTTTLINGLSTIDIVIIVTILVAVMAVGLYAAAISHELPLVSCCSSKTNTSTNDKVIISSPNSSFSNDDEESSFFLANNTMTFIFIGSSLFASNVGSEHFVGMAGDGARAGIAVAMYELYASILILTLGWVFTPIYRRAGIYTTPQFLELRFNSPSCRHYLSTITCIMYIVTKMSASIYGGAIVLSSSLGWDLYWSCGVCIVLSTAYTITGGLRAVMYTDLLQTAIFITGGVLVLYYSLDAINGYDNLTSKLQGTNYLHLFRSVADKDYPVTGMLLGQPIGSIWYWCADQDIVQRVLSSKNGMHAKAGCVLASFLKLFPLFIMIIPGVVAGILFQKELSSGDYDKAYPMLLVNVMPRGVIGIMIASIMTAMMSSLDSVFNAGAAVVTNDFYKRLINPGASASQLVWTGRLATLGFAICSFAWIPIISSGKGLYRQVVELQGYLTPPVGIIFLLGITWPRMNGSGALTGLLIGGVLGVIRLIGVMFIYDDDDDEVNIFFAMNFQHFALLLWVVSGSICVVVSLLTAPPHADTIRFTIYGKAVEESEESSSITGTKRTNAAAVLVLCATFSVWIYFG